MYKKILVSFALVFITLTSINAAGTALVNTDIIKISEVNS